MSSEDEDTNVAHPPVWRTDYATKLFIQADKVKLKYANAFERYSGAKSAKPMKPYLEGHPLVQTVA